MSDNLMSRRRFLLSAGTVAAATGLAGVGLAKVADPAAAAAAQELAWPYPTAEADQPNPEVLARRAFEVYMGQSGAAEVAPKPPGGRSSSFCRESRVAARPGARCL